MEKIIGVIVCLMCLFIIGYTMYILAIANIAISSMVQGIIN